MDTLKSIKSEIYKLLSDTGGIKYMDKIEVKQYKTLVKKLNKKVKQITEGVI